MRGSKDTISLPWGGAGATVETRFFWCCFRPGAPPRIYCIVVTKAVNNTTRRGVVGLLVCQSSVSTS